MNHCMSAVGVSSPEQAEGSQGLNMRLLRCPFSTMGPLGMRHCNSILPQFRDRRMSRHTHIFHELLVDEMHLGKISQITKHSIESGGTIFSPTLQSTH